MIFPLEASELLFFKKGSTAQKLINENRCKIAANGSYFGIDEQKNFFPAGIWLDAENTRNIQSKDPNLQNTIRFFQKTGKADFFFGQTFAEQIPGTVIFNAGPRLLQNKKANPQLTNQISHRKKSVPRTIIAKNEKNQTFLLLFQSNITLEKLTHELTKLKITDAINLDGGPSTSFAEKSSFGKKFQAEELLPIFFCRS